MELVGEEKRIQALFSEFRLADEQGAPSFAGVWNRAQAKTICTPRTFNVSFVAVSALLVCALVSLAWWSTHWQRKPHAVAIAPRVPATRPVKVGDEEVTAPKPPPIGITSSSKSNATNVAARREPSLVAATRKATHEAKAIASWQSPTAALLDSPSDELLKSLPQLNQTVDELRSFLPSQPK